MLADYAARREQSQSMIAEAAHRLFPFAGRRRKAGGRVAKRLDQIDRRMTRLERDVGIAVETLAIFIRFWLTTTPAPHSRRRRWPWAASSISILSRI